MNKIYIKKWMIALLLLVVGLAGLFVCYQNYYLQMVADAEKARSSSETLRTAIYAAKVNLEKEESYAEETEKIKGQTDALLESFEFPGLILEEDQILWIRDQENATGQKQTSIVFGTTSPLYTSSAFTLHQKTFPFNYTATYEGMKNLITYFVENEEDPVSLVSLTITYDPQTSTCSGTMMLRRYYVTGLEDYVPPKIPGVIVGTDEIFG